MSAPRAASGGVGARVVSGWHSFWEAEAPTLSLGVFRVLFAYCLWREVDTTHSKSVFAIAGEGFALPYVDFIGPVPEAVFDAMHWAQYPLIVLLGLGLLRRTSCALLLALQGWVFFADRMNFRNHPYFFLLLLFLMLIAPADEAFSLRAALRDLRHRGRLSLEGMIGPKRPLTWQRLIQVQVCISYFYAGLHKINAGFLRGDVLGRQLEQTVDDWGALLRAWLPDNLAQGLQEGLQSRPSLIAAAVATLVLEIALPFALWFRKTRPLAMVAGIGFHLFIATMMGIHTFSYAMIASYLLFLDPETLPNGVRSYILTSPDPPRGRTPASDVRM